MNELVGIGKIAFYVSSSRDELYGCFPNWGEHQRIRNSKSKVPEPDDSRINDWYLRRFIPIDLKEKIIERDNFTCQECGKKIYCGDEPARKVIKMGTGLFHFDHIVPVQQGGRATEENLRLLCPKCNLRRKKYFSFSEIVEFSTHEQDENSAPQNFAATRRNSPQKAAQSNPIQSNPIVIQSNSIQSSEGGPVYPTLEEVSAFAADRKSIVDSKRFFDWYENTGWKDAGGQPIQNWRNTFLSWERADKKEQDDAENGTNNIFLKILEEERGQK